MPLLVTGGTGYLGQVLVEILSKKFEVRVLVRDKKRANLFQNLERVHWVGGDLRDRESLKRSLSGCEAVFHTAAFVKHWAPHEGLFYEVNVEGFRNLAELSWEEGVKRFIYTSSFLALGPTEISPGKRVFQNSYEASKTKALGLAREYQKKGYPLITVVPTVLYGPGLWTEGNHIGRLLKDLLTGHFPGWLDGGRWRWNFAYVEDVAEGHRLAFERGKTGEEYVLGGEVVSLKEFFTLASELMHRPPPRREVPLAFLWIHAAIQELLAKAFDREPSLTRGVLAIYRHDWAHHDEKGRRELGYTSTPLREALSQTIAWLKETSAS